MSRPAPAAFAIIRQYSPNGARADHDDIIAHADLRILDNALPRAADRFGLARGVPGNAFRFLKQRVPAGERVFGEAAVPHVLRSIATGRVGMLAIMRLPEPAIMAKAAVTARLNDHFIALLHIAHAGTDCGDDARGFVSGHERKRDVASNAFDRFVIGRAKAARADAHQNLSGAGRRSGNLIKFEAIKIF
jgi:hypothetical protein